MDMSEIYFPYSATDSALFLAPKGFVKNKQPPRVKKSPKPNRGKLNQGDEDTPPTRNIQKYPDEVYGDTEIVDRKPG
jgi:hypothetical protein